ncbi:hypothetical protein [Sporomusa termitida]|uniref:Uncharacterized protein n=1 Tax=Sporomusa termitida TaxID=2377 RepID=A0A517DZ36_9FIRM|nr:hypothetical protein [Sporomusa termitida]QDR82516.1 hypothetical protein SPTER_39440 [Sporomusa termitida]
MSHEKTPRLRPTVHAAGLAPGVRHQAGGADAVLKSVLDQAFDQYVFTRVDHILRLAEAKDDGYRQTVRDASDALDRLLALARKLKAQHPEMLDLVMDFEAWAGLESGKTAEIAYRQGLRDSSQLRQEFMTYLQQQADGSTNGPARGRSPV